MTSVQAVQKHLPYQRLWQKLQNQRESSHTVDQVLSQLTLKLEFLSEPWFWDCLGYILASVGKGSRKLIVSLSRTLSCKDKMLFRVDFSYIASWGFSTFWDLYSLRGLSKYWLFKAYWRRNFNSWSDKELYRADQFHTILWGEKLIGWLYVCCMITALQARIAWNCDTSVSLECKDQAGQHKRTGIKKWSVSLCSVAVQLTKKPYCKTAKFKPLLRAQKLTYLAWVFLAQVLTSCFKQT